MSNRRRLQLWWRRGRKKYCAFCAEHVVAIDYKDVNTLERYIAESKKIMPRRMTEVSAPKHRTCTDLEMPFVARVTLPYCHTPKNSPFFGGHHNELLSLTTVIIIWLRLFEIAAKFFYQFIETIDQRLLIMLE